jgi:surface protein
MCTDAPDQPGEVDNKSALIDVFRSPDLTETIFRVVFNNWELYAVDLPSNGPEKSRALHAALFNLCATDTDFYAMCQAQLVRRLQTAVKKVQYELLALLELAKKAFPQQDGNPRQDCHSRENIGFDEWDVWDLAARRNGVEALRHLRQLVNGDTLVEKDAKGLPHHVIAYTTDETIHHLVLTNDVILQLLPHVWGMTTWLQRHMIVYPKVQQWDNDEVGVNPRPTEEMYGPYEAWDVSDVNNMRGMFENVSYFNLPIGAWNVSNVKDMGGMFWRAENFNQPIGAWDVSNVTNMKDMFAFTESFNQPIQSWNVSNVTDMSSMFFTARSFNQPLDGWKVRSDVNTDRMFYGAWAMRESVFKS